MTGKKLRPVLALVSLLLWTYVPGALAADGVKLPQPNQAQGKTVLKALQDRKSDRVYSPKDLSRQQLAEVLWAASGVNRRTGEEKMGRTAPSSHNDQAVDTYVFTKTAVYKYDHVSHELIPFLEGDFRARTGIQSYVADAPLNLVFVADMSRVSGENDRDKLMNVSMDVGHMSANVYLYGASAGLNVICRSNIDPDDLRLLLKLGQHFEPLLGMTIGLPQ